MKRYSYYKIDFSAAAFLLIGTLAVAQSTTTVDSAAKGKAAATTMHPRDAASGQASGRQDQFGHASGLATDNAAAGAQAADKSRNSAHATESLDASKMGNTGENPLYEGKDKTGLKPNAGASNVHPYKDGEDMTTRSRPGNNKPGANSNKTTKVDSSSSKQ